MAKKSNVNIPAIQIIRIIVFLIIGLSLFLAYTKTKSLLTDSDMFQVRDVLIDRSIQFIDVAELRSLKGRNIFKIDIRKLETKIRAKYPQIAQLRVIRELPDRIKVLAKNREALYQVPLKGKFLLVDGEGVAMYYTPQLPEFPVVQGAIGNVKVIQGAAIASKKVALATSMVQAFKTRPRIARLKVTALDLNNLSKISVSIGENLQIILDQENYATKLDMLDMLLAQRKIDFTQVKYVDLRFNEPVLGAQHEPVTK
jgi:cell division septal protein FtsQ